MKNEPMKKRYITQIYYSKNELDLSRQNRREKGSSANNGNNHICLETY